jgi:hypothetical protein
MKPSYAWRGYRSVRYPTVATSRAEKGGEGCASYSYAPTDPFPPTFPDSDAATARAIENPEKSFRVARMLAVGAGRSSYDR